MDGCSAISADHNYIKLALKYSCALCNQWFRNKNVMNCHYVKHSGEKSYNCKICTKKFYTKSDLHCHSVVNHDKKTKYCCKQCASYWITEDMYVEHMRTHAGEKRLYTCVECDRKYKTIAKFRVHRALHFERKVQGSCQVCFKTFVNLRILLSHKCTVQESFSKDATGVPLITSMETYKSTYCDSNQDTPSSQDNVHSHESVIPNESKKSKPKRSGRHRKGNAGDNIQCSVKTEPKMKNIYARQTKSKEILDPNKRPVTKGIKKMQKNRGKKTDSTSSAPKWKPGKGKKRPWPKPIKCEECDTIFDAVSKLRSHMKESTCYGKPGKLTCRSCGKHYSKWYGLLDHHTSGVCGSKLPTCDVCKQTFDTKGQYKDHFKKSEGCGTYLSRVTRSHECLRCGRKFGYLASLEAHQENCAAAEKKRSFECPVCNRVMKNESTYSVHMISHTKEKNYQCVKCQEKFLYKNYLYMHYRQNKSCGEGVEVPALSYNPEELICEYCGKKGFFDRSDYNHHRRFKHQDKDLVSCDKCGASFCGLDSLSKHQKRSCLGDTVCKICSKRGFKNKMEFLKHMGEHDPQLKVEIRKEDRQYKCEKCHSAFMSPSNLSRHRRLVCAHGLICQNCGAKDFKNKTMFTKHVLEHETSLLGPPVASEMTNTEAKAWF